MQHVKDLLIYDGSRELNWISRNFVFQDMASAAESGWDFSSRWFQNNLLIETIETTNIIPIDLNAFMCWNLDILQYLLKQTGSI